MIWQLGLSIDLHVRSNFTDCEKDTPLTDLPANPVMH